MSQPSNPSSSQAAAPPNDSTSSPGATAASKSQAGATAGELIRDAFRQYATTDPRTLGLLRIIFSIFLLIDLYRRLADMTFFYTNDGFLPNHTSIFKPMSAYLFSIYHAASTQGELLVMFGFTAFVYFMLLIGYKTKVWQILSLVLVTSLHSRNILLENGGDCVANILALWTCFLPLGRRFSVDAMLASWREREEKNEDDLNDRSAPLPDTSPIVSVAYVAALLNLFFIYYFNTVHKDGYIWRQATTVHYVLWADRLVQPTGIWLRQWIPMWAVNTLSAGTLIIEASIFILLLSPIWIRACRRVIWFLIIMLHCGFQSVGHFGMFSFIMMTYATLMMGPEDWDSLANRLRPLLPSRVVIYDGMCGICFQVARFIKRLDHYQKMTFVPNYLEDKLPKGVTLETTEQSVVVASIDGNRHWLRADAIAQILRALPYGWAIARLIDLPGIHGLTEWLYNQIAKNRREISTKLGLDACGINRPKPGLNKTGAKHGQHVLFPRFRKFAYGTVLGVFMVAFSIQVAAENRKVPTFLKPPPRAPLKINDVGDALTAGYFFVYSWLVPLTVYPRFFQGWSMFAPIPPTDDGIIVIDGITADGRHIDPLTGGKPVDFDLPDLNHGNMMTQFWYEMHDRLRREQNVRYRENLRDWVVKWHTIENRPPQDRIVEFEAFWVFRLTQPPGMLTRMDTRRTSLVKWKDGQLTLPQHPAAPTAIAPVSRPPRPGSSAASSASSAPVGPPLPGH